jgi:hypothetical protein
MPDGVAPGRHWERIVARLANLQVEFSLDVPLRPTMRGRPVRGLKHALVAWWCAHKILCLIHAAAAFVFRDLRIRE